MNAEQLKHALKRLAPSSRATRKADMLRDVLVALESPAAVDRALAGFAPFELAMLQELKRSGGRANGWVLASFASVHGYKAPPRPYRSYAYERHFANSGVSDYLSGLVIGGVLLPLSENAGWFEYGAGGAAHDQLVADPRLMERVPNDPLKPPATLRLPEVGMPVLTDEHPAARVLKLHGVLQLVAIEGGIRVTKKGEVAKSFLNRLERAALELASELWWTLPLLSFMGLVLPPTEGGTEVWRLDNDAVNSLRRQAPVVQYGRIVDAHAALRDPELERTWQSDWHVAGRDPGAFWRATLDALILLPEHPMPLEAAAAGLWNGALARVFARSYPAHSPRQAGTSDPVIPAALLHLLAGPFVRLGLLAIADVPDEGNGAVKVVRLTEGARWYQQARNAALARHYRGASTQAGDAGSDEQPSLVVQPNFDVLVYLDRLDDKAMLALACAAVTRIDARTATFRIDRSSFEQALETGGTLDGVLAGLAARSPGVPRNVEDSLRDWATRRERLTLRPGVDLVEYSSSAERDSALAALNGARPIGQRFALLPARTPSPAGAGVHDYRRPTTEVLSFSGDGRVKISGQLDLVARSVIEKVGRGLSKGEFEFDPEAVRAGALTPSVRRSLEERAKAGFPPQLDALLRAWSGASPPPAVAGATLFRHPDAALLAEFKQVAGLLDAQLSPSTFLVKAGWEGELRSALGALGLSVGAELAPETGALAAVGEGELQRGLSTRKMRELLEAAVEAGHDVEIEYAEERESWTRHGSYRRSRGKVRTEVVTPESVSYQGSTPYLNCYTVARGTDRTVRIGYIDALAVRVSGG